MLVDFQIAAITAYLLDRRPPFSSPIKKLNRRAQVPPSLTCNRQAVLPPGSAQPLRCDLVGLDQIEKMLLFIDDNRADRL